MDSFDLQLNNCISQTNGKLFINYFHFFVVVV